MADTAVTSEGNRAADRAAAAAAPPAGVDVLCPMCSYNLRGLAEPRCPECGYASTWAELTDARLRPHPYLFEHHPEKSVRSFLRTLLGTALPRRFWPTVPAGQPVRVWRLTVYLLLCWLPLPLVVAGALAGRAELVRRTQNSAWLPASRINYATGLGVVLARPATQDDEATAALRRDVAAAGSIAQYVARTQPDVTFGQSWDTEFSRTWDGYNLKWRPIERAAVFVMLLVSWPVASFVGVAAMQGSLRRAKLRRDQLWRAHAYTFEWVGLMAMSVALALAAMWLHASAGPSPDQTSLGVLVGEFASRGLGWTVPMMLAAVATYRLWRAMRDYLQFPHALAAAATVQAVTLLAGYTLMVALGITVADS
jgi:hypothetical protein